MAHPTMKMDFQWILNNYLCNFIDTDYKMTIQSIIIHENPVR